MENSNHRTSKNPLIYIESDQIKGYDVDLFQRATIPAVVLKMHEAAMSHVLQLGFSAKELVEQNLGWVLVQQYFEFFRQPLLGEKITVRTNPTGKERVFTYRDFYMKDEKDNIVAQASSSWLLMDIAARKMVMRYPKDIDEMLASSNDFDRLPHPPSLKFKIKNPSCEKEFQVGFHDLDFNGHLSNFFYFKWMLDTLPSEWLKTRQLKTLNMRFKEECYLDDKIKVLAEKIEEDTYVHILLKNEKVLVEGKTVWK